MNPINIPQTGLPTAVPVQQTGIPTAVPVQQTGIPTAVPVMPTQPQTYAIPTAVPNTTPMVPVPQTAVPMGVPVNQPAMPASAPAVVVAQPTAGTIHAGLPAQQTVVLGYDPFNTLMSCISISCCSHCFYSEWHHCWAEAPIHWWPDGIPTVERVSPSSPDSFVVTTSILSLRMAKSQITCPFCSSYATLFWCDVLGQGNIRMLY